MRLFARRAAAGLESVRRCLHLLLHGLGLPVRSFITGSVVCVFAAVAVSAPDVGNTEKAVIDALGAPQIERAQGNRKIWIYGNGSRLVLVNGVVTEATIAPTATEPKPAATPATDSPAPGSAVTPPSAEPTPPPRSKPSSTTSTKPETNRPRIDLADEPNLSPAKGIVAFALAGLGWLISAVGGVWLLVAAFRTSLLWGFLTLFVPLAGIVFVFAHWDEAKRPFLVSLAGIAVLCSPLLLAAL